ncbi:MAG: hypothetical protein CVU39_27870 [Chloroflexi bacterium HGW-Chloroflexi-10]|nr:MAG: hypothetical protein CVU39_27870 [Chloroflexi bacterium HGW-Chloroflexi-10]
MKRINEYAWRSGSPHTGICPNHQSDDYSQTPVSPALKSPSLTREGFREGEFGGWVVQIQKPSLLFVSGWGFADNPGDLGLLQTRLRWVGY